MQFTELCKVSRIIGETPKMYIVRCSEMFEDMPGTYLFPLIGGIRDAVGQE